MAWQRLVDPASGKPYYYEDKAGVTQWEFPDRLLVDVLGRHGWDKALTDDGLMYFYNSNGESIWDIPTNVMAELKSKFGTDITEAEVKGLAVDEVIDTLEEEKDTVKKDEVIETPEEKMEDVNVQEEETEKTEKAPVNRVNEILGITVKQKEMSVEKEMETTFADKEARFLKMLEEKEVSSGAKFESSICNFVKDERYWEIENPILKKQLFDMFVKNKKAEEIREFKETHRKTYYEFLKKANVKYYSRWVTFNKIYEMQEDGLKNADEYAEIPYEIKEDFFNAYVKSLRQEREEHAKSVKQDDIIKLEEEMGTDLTLNDEFAKVVGKYEEKYKNLNKDDILTAFKKTIAKLEKKQKDVFEHEKKLNLEIDCKARAEFKERLRWLIETGKFKPHSRTRWYEFVGALKEYPEFVELCGHRGSSAIDYYWDMIEFENEKLRGKIELFKQQLINFNKKITDLDETQFIKLMHRSNKPEINVMNDSDLASVYSMMKPPKSTTVKRTADQADLYSKDRDKRPRMALRR